MAIKIISLKETEEIIHELTQRTMSWNEPIPDFKTRRTGILESCLAVPFQKFLRRNLYKGLTEKAAVLFYLMIKNHPFLNGNKRIAVTTLLYFLNKNEKTLNASNEEVYEIAVWVARSNRNLKDETIQATKKFIEIHLKDY